MSHVQELVCLRESIDSLVEVLPHFADGPQKAALERKLDDIVFMCSKLKSPGRYCYFQGNTASDCLV
jgi:hypothetical protein